MINICLIVLLLIIIIILTFYISYFYKQTEYLTYFNKSELLLYDITDINNNYMFNFDLKKIITIQFKKKNKYLINIVKLIKVLEETTNVKANRIKIIKNDTDQLTLKLIILKSDNPKDVNIQTAIRMIKKAMKEPNSTLIKEFSIESFKIEINYVNSYDENIKWWSFIEQTPTITQIK